MGLGVIMMGLGGCLILTGVLRWLCSLIKGTKEKRQMELRMREKY